MGRLVADSAVHFSCTPLANLALVAVVLLQLTTVTSGSIGISSDHHHHHHPHPHHPHGYDYPARWTKPSHGRRNRRPVDVITDVVNDLGVKVLDRYIEHPGNVGFSPSGLGFVLAALYEGSAGSSGRQIGDVLGLPSDRRITRIGFRDIHRRLRSYLNADAFLGGLTLNRDDINLRPEYEDVLRFYGFDISDSGNATTAAIGATVTAAGTLAVGTDVADATPTQVATQAAATAAAATNPPPTINDAVEIITTPGNVQSSALTVGSTAGPTTMANVPTTMPAAAINAASPSVTSDASVTPVVTPNVPPTMAPMSGSTLTPVAPTTLADSSVASVTTMMMAAPAATTMASMMIMSIVQAIMNSMNVAPTTNGAIQSPVGPATAAADMQSQSSDSSTVSMGATFASGVPVAATSPMTTVVTVPMTAVTGDAVMQRLMSSSMPSGSTVTTVSPGTNLATVANSANPTTNPANPSTNSANPTTNPANPTIDSIANAATSTTNVASLANSVNSGTSVTNPAANPTTNPGTNAEISAGTTAMNSPSLTTNPGTNAGDSTTNPATDSTAPTMNLMRSASANPTTDSSTIPSSPPMATLLSTITTMMTTLMTMTESMTDTDSANETTMTSPMTTQMDDTMTTMPGDTMTNNVRKRRSVLQGPSGYFSSSSDDSIWLDVFGRLTSNDDYQTQDEDIIENPSPSTQLDFLVNGCDYSRVTAATYTAVLPFGYFPSLRTSLLEFPLDDPRYKILVMLPDESSGTRRLARILASKSITLRHLRRTLQPTWVTAVIPSFMLRGFVTLTPYLQRLGISDVFEPRTADLSPMSPDLGVYARDIQQSIGVNIRNNMRGGIGGADGGDGNQQPVPPANLARGARGVGVPPFFGAGGPIPFVVDRPFLYFIIDDQTSVALLAGRIDDPLNSRIML